MTDWLYNDIMWRSFSENSPDYIEVDRDGKYGTLFGNMNDVHLDNKVTLGI